MTKKQKEKHDGLFMKAALSVIVLQVIVYTWVCAYWSYRAGTEIAPVQSAAFYAFCGFECGVCGYIKTKIDKKKKENNNGT